MYVREKNNKNVRVSTPDIFPRVCAVDLSWQELAAMDDVAPYICGAVVADGPVFPGATWRGSMTVDETICPNAQYSVVSMLSEYSSNLLL